MPASPVPLKAARLLASGRASQHGWQQLLRRSDVRTVNGALCEVCRLTMSRRRRSLFRKFLFRNFAEQKRIA
eukprot:4286003-Alexandrium_andersonii.AAC.1